MEKIWYNHKLYFNERTFANSTKLSKCVWLLNDQTDKYHMRKCYILKIHKLTTEIIFTTDCVKRKKFYKQENAESEISDWISKCEHDDKFFVFATNSVLIFFYLKSSRSHSLSHTLFWYIYIYIYIYIYVCVCVCVCVCVLFRWESRVLPI